MLRRFKSVSLISIVLLLAMSMVFITGNVHGVEKSKKPLKKPDIVKSLKKTSVKQTTIGLKWKKAKRAEKYVVYLSQSKTKKQIVTKKNAVTLNGLSPSKKYSITVKAKNKAGLGKRSKKIVVTTLMNKPVITSQSPTSLVFDDSDAITLFVTAKGKGLKYKWYSMYSSDSEPVCYSPLYIAKYDEDENTDTFVYYCVVSNKAGSVRSKNIMVVKPPGLKITKQTYLKTAPAAADSLYKGNRITIAVECENAASYQWYYSQEEPEGGDDDDDWDDDEWDEDDWEFKLFSLGKRKLELMANIEPQTERKLIGQTASTLNLACTQADTGYYFCKIIDTRGKTYQSDPLKIIVHGDPDILNNDDLENILISVGRSAKFELETTDAVWFEWQAATKTMYNASPRQWNTVNKAIYGTGHTLTIQNCEASKDSFAIRCIVHGYGTKTVISKIQRLYVGAAPHLVRNTTSVTVKKGKGTTISITEKAGTSYSTSYQWYKIDSAGKTTALTGATGKSHKINTINNSAKYFVKAKNPFTDGEWEESAKITVRVVK